MNPHREPSISLTAMLRGLALNRSLIWQMALRDVVGRYKGSMLGIAWSFFSPVLMLGVYTFVFAVVFQARWGTSPTAHPESRTDFALVLFVGLIVHGLLAEVLNRAPNLILVHQNFVKRVVFPLEILPVVSLLAALFHSAVSLVVLLMAFALFNGHLHGTAVLVPLIWLPLAVLTLGLAWILSSLGVFLRDVSQTMGLVTSVMLFLSPVFYPISALPGNVRPWLMLNPLTFVIEQSREVLVWGRYPDWHGLLLYSLAAVAIACIGYAWFQKTRKGFADVI